VRSKRSAHLSPLPLPLLLLLLLLVPLGQLVLAVHHALHGLGDRVPKLLVLWRQAVGQSQAVGMTWCCILGSGRLEHDGYITACVSRTRSLGVPKGRQRTLRIAGGASHR
jgi:hypothetical protein